MIEVRQIKLPITHTEADLKLAIKKRLGGTSEFTYEISKMSIDSRKKDALRYVYSVLVSTKQEDKVLQRTRKDNDISKYKPVVYQHPSIGEKALKLSPVIVGAGPAGLFCGLCLAQSGYAPIILERGGNVDERTADIEAFWRDGVLKPDSNVQFGEGGAGTFSDGKLNTLVKDKYGRNRFVLETFVKYGAPKEILIESKPHIGTDLLRIVIKNMREEIIRLGGEVRFHHKLTDIMLSEDGTGVQSIVVADEVGEQYSLNTNTLVLALGHSARDTFYMLLERKLTMTPKPFAIGLRVEHDREMIQSVQYGDSVIAKQLPTASYKVTHQASDGRGVFSFCMCPGGFVVNASSEPGMLAVNGMSNHARDEKNSNSAIIVSVTPEDYDGTGPLAGVEFQRKWEQKAYEAGKGKVPVQRFQDFCDKKKTTAFGKITPNIKGNYEMADLNNCLPEYVVHDIIEGIFSFDKKLTGFADGDTILAGIESRTSSPVRIERDDSFQSNIKGIYPCGEGAGYAGGIMSAAMDGMKVYEAIASQYAPKQNR